RLVAGHCRDPVVEDYDGHVCTVVDRVEEPLDAGMQERRITNRADHVALLTGMRDAARDRDGCAHADGGVNHPELEPEGVAPDVTRVDRIFEHLLDRIERPAVQAAGTEYRGPGGQVRERFRGGERACPQESRLYHDRSHSNLGQFALIGCVAVLLPENRYTTRNLPHGLLDFRSEFLDNEHLLVFPDEIPEPFLVDRISADLHEGDIFMEELLHIGRPDPAR